MQAAIVAAVALLLSADRISPALVLSILIALSAGAWLSGKRATVAMILGGLFFAFWQRGLMRGWRLIAIGCISLIAFATFSVGYQAELRSEIVTANSYQGFRIDYGRDSQIRLSIFAQQNPERIRVLPEVGTTLPLYVGQLVPRAIWPEKPLPYSQYFTSAVFLSPPQLWGYGITTSWYEEWISNIGVAGYAVAPLLLGFMCRWANRVRDALPRAGLTVILVLLVVLHVAAFAALIPLVFALVVWERLSHRTALPVATDAVDDGRISIA
ncbi:hypothetical protein [Microbacterium suwonense]|uniref:hypothetical protein n=1 Tax=Microbacterium suwonense TaxID=683047 RepID=UPI002573BF4B|nr:hypothetical protein [Microbacterium suwonense]